MQYFDNEYGMHGATYKKWKELEGAHAADLFRYCLLFDRGGVYLDIKIVLLKPLRDMFYQSNTLYTVLGHNAQQIFQGVLVSYPHNPIFAYLIEQALHTSAAATKIDYFVFIAYFLACLKKYYSIEGHWNRLRSNFPDDGVPHNVYLYLEKCGVGKAQCEVTDRHGLCCYIFDPALSETVPVIKTRYDDYPWK
jgi:hypothetical protein